MKNNCNFFSNPKLSWLWFLLRIYVGWAWLTAGWEKVINPTWVGSQAGVAITGFLNGSLAKATGAHPQVASWYADFIKTIALPNSVIFSYIISYGELLVGIGLILGAFTVTAAFFGALMNLNFLYAGSVSTNPTLLILQILIMVAGKTAGSVVGLDRFLSSWIASCKKNKSSKKR